MRIVLWDVDGTLLYNSAKAGTFYHDAIRQVAGVGPAPDEPHAVEHGKTDAQIVTERLARWGGDPAHLPVGGRSSGGEVRVSRRGTGATEESE